MTNVDKGLIAGFPVLNSNVRAAMGALVDAGLLGEFHTSLDTTRFVAAARRTRWGSTIARRALPNGVHKVTRSHPAHEISRLMMERSPLRRMSSKSSVDVALRAIDHVIERRLGNGFAGVYGYEDAALAAFTRAAEMGLPRIYDLPIAYWRLGERLLDDEAERQPEWAGTLSHRRYANRSERQARKDEELRLASRIVVATSFTRDSLREFPGDLAPVSVVQYGAPTPVGGIQVNERGPLKVLFVGGLSQRKGISYFFDALTGLDVSVDVTVVGRKVGESAALDQSLRQVNWIPTAPHQRILELMRSSDVLVFPSLFEGFGLVLTEALSQGLPIISTAHTAAPDLINDGVEGWIIPIRSAEAIRERLRLLADDRDLVDAMKEAALTRSRSLLWSAYKEGIVRLVQSAWPDNDDYDGKQG